MTQPISNLAGNYYDGAPGQLSASPQNFDLDLLQMGASQMQSPESPSLDFSGISAGVATGNPYVAAAGGVVDVIKFGTQMYMSSKAEEKRQKELAKLEKRQNQITNYERAKEGQRYQTQLGFQIEDREMMKEQQEKNERINSFNRFFNTFQNKLSTNAQLRDRFIQRGHRGL